MMEQRNIAITVAYDGTNYCGWQVQPDQVSISSEIIDSIKRITNETVCLYGSGRTDAGVHAFAQVANFYTHSRIPIERMAHAINAYLPKDIVVTQAWEADGDFHSRFSAKRKSYEYYIYNSEMPSPFLVNRVWQIKHPLDADKMREGAQYLVGEHDFRAFMASGSAVKETVRTLYSLDVEKRGNIIGIYAEGNGFLYNMVRIIAGNLMYVGSGKMKPEDMKSFLQSKDRTKGAITAPAHALYLKKVFY